MSFLVVLDYLTKTLLPLLSVENVRHLCPTVRPLFFLVLIDSRVSCTGFPKNTKTKKQKKTCWHWAREGHWAQGGDWARRWMAIYRFIILAENLAIRMLRRSHACFVSEIPQMHAPYFLAIVESDSVCILNDWFNHTLLPNIKSARNTYLCVQAYCVYA